MTQSRDYYFESICLYVILADDGKKRHCAEAPFISTLEPNAAQTKETCYNWVSDCPVEQGILCDSCRSYLRSISSGSSTNITLDN